MIKIWQFTGAVALCIASVAHSEEHRVVLTGFSYFPSVVYAQPGDSVIFINESGEEQTVVGRDTGWVVGPLGDQQEGQLTINEETELAFFAAYAAEEDDDTDETSPNSEYGDYDEAPIKAEITFDEPNLSGS
ncbi:hypothetical protein E4Z66_09300 [Aliishimia ponticola]|uniref:Uncharacterized protein n=1 Tax=Aliishimia ponticola TaxID=2499833 RepID=A0A4S4NG54_9RHOB|nr:hypothetical protein [Aliishimia ponticola]THH37118.1 hypothetical protein E4Z66_09300 [Aliishimia ponticola]